MRPLNGLLGGSNVNQGKKLGRPTDAPKDTTIRLRIDKETLKRLDLYAEAQGLNRSEAIRRLINEA
jgi:hypothetical protein